MNTKDELVEWLCDAYAMEKAQEMSLKKQVDSDDTLQPLREQFEVHYIETQQHAAAVESCLKSLNTSTSALKTTFAQAVETVKDLGASFARDAGVKAMLASYAAEHFEIGCYVALAAGARNLDMPAIADTCEKILVEEKRMAAWLEANLPNAVTSYLREAGPEAGDEASSLTFSDETSEFAQAGVPPSPSIRPSRRGEDIDMPIEAGADDDPADAFLNDETEGHQWSGNPRGENSPSSPHPLNSAGLRG